MILSEFLIFRWEIEVGMFGEVDGVRGGEFSKGDGDF